jgi:peptide/nickel transport system permease protein
VDHPWLRFALRRGLTLLVSLWILLTATFLTVQLVPGDPARVGLGMTASAGEVQARRAALRLDRPLPAQYAGYVGAALRGDLGVSFTNRRPVAEIIGERFPATATLAAAAFVVALLGVPLGMLVGIATRGGRRPRVAGVFSVGTGALISVPEFIMATGLVAAFGVGLAWLPVAGNEGFASYLLPVTALGALPAAALARLARVETLKALDQEYMRVARGKRLPGRVLHLRHLLPNAVTATLTVSGLLLGGLIAGTVVVENIFAWPGLGSAVTQALLDKDYPMVQGIVLLLGGIALTANTTVDVLLALLDPRSLVAES